MKVYDLQVLLEPDAKMRGYVVSCPALPGCYTQGDTIDEALENIKSAGSPRPPGATPRYRRSARS